jgi:LacI family transcriptional regulator
MATSEDVARLAGVSRATVSRALNGSARVSAEARERVHTAIAILGYEPDVIARSLVRQRTNVLAVSLFAEDHEQSISHFGRTPQYFYLRVMEHIEHEAITLGYDLLLPSYTHGKSPVNYVRSLQTRRVAGCIMLQATDARVQALIHSSIPTVFIDRMGQGSHATYIKSDNIDGARQATEHLLSLGHRRIAFLTGSTIDLAGLECLLGCQQTLAKAGMAPDVGLVRHSGWNIDEAYEATKFLLAERRDFTAIVAGSDFMAIGILRALTEQGLRVPDDVSLVGFNDIEFGRYTTPPLTTVRQDHVAMGRGAVQRLVAMIEGAEEASPLILPTQLVVRKSTGPASKDLD